MGFLVVSSLLLLRAAVVFVRDYGSPAPADMFAAKFSSVPYDFHYYGLQNPTQTSLWVLLPMTLGCYWAARPGSSTTGRPDRKPSGRFWSRRTSQVVRCSAPFGLEPEMFQEM